MVDINLAVAQAVFQLYGTFIKRRYSKTCLCLNEQCSLWFDISGKHSLCVSLQVGNGPREREENTLDVH